MTLTKRNKTLVCSAYLILISSLWASPKLDEPSDDSAVSWNPDWNPVTMEVNAGWVKAYPQQQGLIWTYAVSYAALERNYIQIKVKQYPSKRGRFAFLRKDVDVHSASEESLGASAQQLIKSELPIAILGWHIYYNKQQWQPTWPPDSVFKNKLGKSQMSAPSLKRMYGLNIKTANSVDSIIKMLQHKRLDYWIDYSSAVILMSAELQKLQLTGYVLEPLFSRPIHTYFQNTKKGRALKKIFDNGLLGILKRGEFIDIHQKMLMPKDINSTKNTLAYIRKRYPEFNIPRQKQEE